MNSYSRSRSDSCTPAVEESNKHVYSCSAFVHNPWLSPRMTTATIWRLVMMMKLYSMALHWNALPRCRCSFFPGLPVVYVPILLYRISFCVILATSYPPSLFGLCLVLSLFTRFIRPLFLSQLEPSCPVL